MAFGCILHLKQECDGCMRCQDSGYSYGRQRSPFDDDAGEDPFEIDHNDER